MNPPPPGIQFSDLQSEINYRTAMTQLPTDGGRLFVITGPMASGKTRLAKHIIRHHFPKAGIAAVSPLMAAGMNYLNCADEPYLLIDDGFRPRPIRSKAMNLQRSTVSEGLVNFIKVPGRLLIVTGGAVELSPDLSRRALTINLGEPS
jgi:hypothetical protein